MISDKSNYQNVKIITIESDDDVLEFLGEINESEELTVSNHKRIKEIFEMLGYPFTVVYEEQYVDKIYRDTFYTYFASKHILCEKNCKRLCFFKGVVDSKKFYSFDDETEEYLQRQFIGVCIFKPIKVGKIGKTLLDPAKINIAPSYVRTTSFKFMIIGHNLSVESFSYSSQDSETMTCAETTVWNILEYFGTRYSEYRTVLPSQMISELEKISQERTLPSRGLDYYKVSGLLKIFGFSPRLYAADAYKEESFKKIFHYYVESGIPLAVGVSAKKDKQDVKHSVVCIGHGAKKKNLRDIHFNKIGEYKYIDTADMFDEYVLIDDNQHPYMIEPFDNFTKYDEPKVVIFAVPLYKRVFLEANDASVLVNEILKHKNIGFTDMVSEIDEAIDDDNPFVIRLYLTSSRKYKSFHTRKEKKEAAKYFYSTIRLPKFIWVAEISTYKMYKKNKIYGEIVIDATSSRTNHIDSLIMMRYLNHIGFRMPNESTKNIFDGLKHRTVDFSYPYDMYYNNLKNCGGKKNNEDV